MNHLLSEGGSLFPGGYVPNDHTTIVICRGQLITMQGRELKSLYRLGFVTKFSGVR